jgi:hypothetical protein
MELDPPIKTIEPALVSLEVPVESSSDPEPPDAEAPVYSDISPLLAPVPDTGDDLIAIGPVGPELLAPLCNNKLPLVPATDKPVSNTNKPPLDFPTMLFPPESLILPPSLLDDSPALSSMLPPIDDELLRPAAITIEPPCPTNPSPPFTETSPPSVPDPLAMFNPPPISVKLPPAASNIDDPIPLLSPADKIT